MSYLPKQPENLNSPETVAKIHFIPKSVRRQQLNKLKERGQSMVEMALILPLFLAFVLSIIEIGRAWATKQSLTLAAREGARVLVLPYGAGLTYSNEAQKQDAAVKIVSSYLTTSGVGSGADTTITVVRLLPMADQILDTNDDKIEDSYSGGKRGDRVGIRIQHKFDTALPIILTMFNSNQPDQTGVNMGVTCFLEHE